MSCVNCKKKTTKGTLKTRTEDRQLTHLEIGKVVIGYISNDWNGLLNHIVAVNLGWCSLDDTNIVRSAAENATDTFKV